MAAAMASLGVKYLVDQGITQIPDLYVLPPEKRPTSFDPVDKHSVPVIDLAGLNSPHRGQTLQQIYTACHEWGFMQVINHGVSADICSKMLSIAQEFFDMPIDEKAQYSSTDINTPVSYGTGHYPTKEGVLEWQDFLLQRFMPPHNKEHPWPQKPASYKSIGKAYLADVTKLGKLLLSTLSEAIGLKQHVLEEALGDHQVALRLNYYPACPNPDLAIGLNAHSDIGGLTIVLQNVCGLQIRHQDQWLSLKLHPGALIVNIADQLEVLTNGKYRSVEHRAILNDKTTRISVAVFLDPSSDVNVAPLSQLVDDEHPALYNPCVFGKYVENLFSSSLDGRAFIEALKQVGKS